MTLALTLVKNATDVAAHQAPPVDYQNPDSTATHSMQTSEPWRSSYPWLRQEETQEVGDTETRDKAPGYSKARGLASFLTGALSMMVVPPIMQRAMGQTPRRGAKKPGLAAKALLSALGGGVATGTDFLRDKIQRLVESQSQGQGQSMQRSELAEEEPKMASVLLKAATVGVPGLKPSTVYEDTGKPSKFEDVARRGKTTIKAEKQVKTSLAALLLKEATTRMLPLSGSVRQLQSSGSPDPIPKQSVTPTQPTAPTQPSAPTQSSAPVTSVGEFNAADAAQMAGANTPVHRPVQQPAPQQQPQQQPPVSQQPPQSATEAVTQAAGTAKPPEPPVRKNRATLAEEKRVNTLNKKFVDPIHAEQAIASGLKPAKVFGQQRLGQMMTDRLVPSWLRSTKALNQIGDRRDILERQSLLRQNAVSRYGGHGDIPEVAAGPKLPGDNKGGAGGLNELLRAHLYSSMFSGMGGGGGMYPGAFMGGQQSGGGLQNILQNLAAIQALEGGGKSKGTGTETGEQAAPRNRMEELERAIAKRTGIGVKKAPAGDAAGGKDEVSDALERLQSVADGGAKKTETPRKAETPTPTPTPISITPEPKAETPPGDPEATVTDDVTDAQRAQHKRQGAEGAAFGGVQEQIDRNKGKRNKGKDEKSKQPAADEPAADEPLELVEDAVGKGKGRNEFGKGKGKGRNEFGKGAGKGGEHLPPHHNAKTDAERQAIKNRGRLVNEGLADPSPLVRKD